MKHKTKNQMMWEVSKEFERQFRDSILIDYDKEELDDLFKMIRGTEYRRGKEDALKEMVVKK